MTDATPDIPKWCREDERATLRAQVESLDNFIRQADDVTYIRLDDVLALIDAGTGRP